MARRWLLLILGLGLVRGILYALIVPPWQAPDEIAHFEYSRLLLDYARPVTRADASSQLEGQIIQSLYQFRAWDYVGWGWPNEKPARLDQAPFYGASRTLARFSLAYILYALAAWPWKNQDVVIQLYSMRLMSVVLGLGSIGLTWLTARRLAPYLPALAAGATLLMTFWPQHTFQMSAVGEGVLAELLISGALCLFVEMTVAGTTWLRLGGYLACVLLAVLTKATAYFLVPLTLVLGLSSLRDWSRGRFSNKPWRNLIWLSVAGLAGVVVRMLIWGSRAAPNSSLTVGQALLKLSLNNLSDMKSALVSYFFSGRMADGLWMLFRSFWAVLGWMALFVPEYWYQVLFGVCLLALGGLVLFRQRHMPPVVQPALAGLGLAAALVVLTPILTALLLWKGNPADALQGRYVLSGTLPIAILLVLGLLNWAPKRHAWLVVGGMVGGLVALDTAVLCYSVILFFYSF